MISPVGRRCSQSSRTPVIDLDDMSTFQRLYIGWYDAVVLGNVTKTAACNRQAVLKSLSKSGGGLDQEFSE
jgi:hypothetical protein